MWINNNNIVIGITVFYILSILLCFYILRYNIKDNIKYPNYYYNYR